jgi:hypothetical protein
LKDSVELHRATESNLSRVTAPLFVNGGTGIKDEHKKRQINTWPDIVPEWSPWSQAGFFLRTGASVVLAVAYDTGSQGDHGTSRVR